MTTTICILRKDARHLWPHVAGCLLLMALCGFLDPAYGSGRQSAAYGLLVGFALPLACWNLVIAAIHEEKLPGDRQYWLTRPYSWKALLAAKALFVVLFLNLPLFIWHVAALRSAGIPVAEHLPALLWRQVFFSAFYLLPVALLAALTKGLGELILTALLTLVPVPFLEIFLVSHFQRNWQRIDGMMLGIAGIVSVGIALVLALQYSARNTRLSRTLACVVAAAVVAFAFAADKLSRGTRIGAEDSPLKISIDRQGSRHSTVMPSRRANLVTLDIPVRIEGIPAGVHLIQNEFTVWMEGGGKRTWHLDGRTEGGFHDVSDGTAWLSLYIDRASLEALGTVPANVRGSGRFLAFGNQQILPLPQGRSVVVPRVGVCSDTRDDRGFISLVCYTPQARASVTLGTTPNRLNWIIPQGLVETFIPTSSDFQPLTRYTSLLSYRTWEEIGVTRLMAAEPLPQMRITFQLPDVHLSDYVVGAR